MSRGWSPQFLRELANELERVERAVDRLDAHMEKAKTKRTKDRLTVQRAGWLAYERRVRRVLAAGAAESPRAQVQSEQPTKEDPDGA